MKKGDMINISTRYGIKRVEILSIGKKYITTTHRYKFHSDTLREVDEVGISAYIIPNLDEWTKKQQRGKNESTIDVFFRHNTDKLSDGDLEEILNIIKKYK